ncbi:coth protein-domain-containing protein [Zychaea mexicana]|uniref:coth protein-domain-containing protein n=1 Tax=Zychaea mexicana TaxID=64656 RepID=UPI0022FEA1CA|nr:coth protein-domain-containing protein [Zychaea mexicana]KAI9484701.1 coth protein-domain-containing protein [Zychaea mexicana]
MSIIKGDRKSVTSAAAVDSSGTTTTASNNKNVQYCVMAFPNAGEGVSVSISGQTYTLQSNNDHPNLFCGSAPYGQVYQYAYTDSSGAVTKSEEQRRSLSPNAATTGNEFFDRAPTVYSVPELPQAFHPIYPPLFTNMNNSNEVATMILNVDEQAFGEICRTPLEKHHKGAQVYKLTYISNSEIHTITNAAIDNSGQSTKEFARQSFEIDFNKFVTDKNLPKQLLFGRSVVKLRGEQTDGSFILRILLIKIISRREKLVMDMLAAAGAATSMSSWVRVFVNDTPLGLFLMTDDASTHFIDNVLHGGDWSYANTGPTYKGNSLDDQHCANLEYLGDDTAAYKKDIYKLKDKGEAKDLKKGNKTLPLVEFTRQLAKIDPKQATDAQNRGDLEKLIDPTNLMLHMAINYLVGSWDGFWFQASNFYLNQDLATKQWALIAYDFDETLGNGVETAGFVNVRYEAYTPSSAKRPLVDAILESPYYRNEFETILKTLVKKFFKPSVIKPRLEAWIKMLRQDVGWDRSLPDTSPGKKVTWTVADMEAGALGISATKGAQVGNSDLSLSIVDWVQQRSELVCKQFGISDNDDLLPIGTYTGGRVMDGSGHVTDRAAITSPQQPGSKDDSVPPAGDSTVASSAAAGVVVPQHTMPLANTFLSLTLCFAIAVASLLA